MKRAEQEYVAALLNGQRTDLMDAQRTLELLAEYTDQVQDELNRYLKEINRMEDQIRGVKRDMKAIGKETKGVIPDDLRTKFLHAYDYIRKTEGGFDIVTVDLMSAINLLDTVEKEADKESMK